MGGDANLVPVPEHDDTGCIIMLWYYLENIGVLAAGGGFSH